MITSASYLVFMVLCSLSQDERMGDVAFAYHEILLGACTRSHRRNSEIIPRGILDLAVPYGSAFRSVGRSTRVG